jgi:putative toxin-antitoxin system antitoxin component (TIGR02293 family)
MSYNKISFEQENIMEKQVTTGTTRRKSAARPAQKKTVIHNRDKVVKATKVTAKHPPNTSTKDTRRAALSAVRRARNAELRKRGAEGAVVVVPSQAPVAKDVVDFYCNGVALEIKKSRVSKTHDSDLFSAWRMCYSASDFERIKMIREGVPAALLVDLGRVMNISNELLFTALALPRSTVVRKIQEKKSLSADQSERVIGLERLVGQVGEMVTQSGNPEGFDAGRWVGEWLQRPLPALAGKRPAEFMDTMAGQDLISKLLAQSQSGAYA